MFPEPLTTISFTLGCVSFLLSSLPNLDQRRRQILECRDFLLKFEGQLVNLESTYQGWCTVWGGLTQDQYIQAWGTQSSINRVKIWTADIDDRFRRIEEEIRGNQRDQFRRVLDRIRQSFPRGQEADMPNEGDVEWWIRMTDRIRRQTSQSAVVPDENVRNTGIGYRIAFSFYKNDVLKTNMDILAKTVADLDIFTTREYWKLRWTYTKPTPTQSELDRALRLQRLLNEFTDFGRNLYQAQLHKNRNVDDRSRRLWTLELRTPDLTGNSADIDSFGRVNIDFCLADDFNNPPVDLKRVRIFYPLTTRTTLELTQNMEISTMVETLYGELSGRDWINCNRDGFSSLVSPKRCSAPLRRLFEWNTLQDEKVFKASVLDRLTLAVGVVNWTLLLWLTEWTSELCCCQIHLQELPKGEKRFTLSVENHACEGTNRQRRKIVSLGVMLAEILVGTPMRAHPSPQNEQNVISVQQNRQQPWLVERWKHSPLAVGGFWETIQINEVLQDVKSKVDEVGGSQSVVAAVGFCLSNPTF